MNVSSLNSDEIGQLFLCEVIIVMKFGIPVYAGLESCAGVVFQLPDLRNYCSVKSKLRYWMASAMCSTPISSAPSRSAMVLATRRIRS